MPKSVNWSTKPSTPTRDLGRERVGDLGRGAGDEPAPAAEPALAPSPRSRRASASVARERRPGAASRRVRVARERAQLGEPVDRVGRAVPPVGVVAHERHRELRARRRRCAPAGAATAPGRGRPIAPREREVLAGEVERLAREHQVEDLERLARGAPRAPSAGRRRSRRSRARRRPSPSRCRARAGRSEITSTVAAILARTAGWRNGSHVTRWPMRIVVVRDRERGRERPALERVVVGRGRRREVVHQPDRVEAGGLGRERALEDRRRSSAAAGGTGRTRVRVSGRGREELVDLRARAGRGRPRRVWSLSLSCTTTAPPG